MTPREEQSWFPASALTGQCAWCKYRVAEMALVSCEYGQPWFPHARTCHRYEPEDLDE